MSPVPLNPIIPGFSPDPSVVLVDDTFFLVTSTFHLFPGLPIYTSTDLTSWKQIGNVINRTSQLKLAGSHTNIMPPFEDGDVMLATGGLYAPTIRYHNGTFYVICTNIVRSPESTTSHSSKDTKDRTENFFVSTKDIWKGEWSDPIYFEFWGIDPSFFFDDDGKVYMQGSASPGPMTKINLFEIDLATGKKLSEEKTIWDGNGEIYPEGPHIYKRDGYYYVMISEGGTHEGHSITVARSKNIWGPYESNPANPILTAKGTPNYIRYTGHTEFFQDTTGNWWGVCLGVRKDSSARYNMGRETFLFPGEWKTGEWPILSQPMPEITAHDGTVLTLGAGKKALEAVPGVDYLYIRDPVLEDYEFDYEANNVTVKPSQADMVQFAEPVTFVSKRQRVLDGETVTSLRLDPSSPASLKAGLAYYKDEHRFIKLFYDYSKSSITLLTYNKAKGIERTSTAAFDLGGKEAVVGLKVTYTEASFKFSWKAEGGEWKDIEEFDSLEMVGPDFVGPVIGVWATAEKTDVKVKFEGFVVQ